MAQVKKFQPGGVLTVNGKTYTPEQINEFLQHGGFDSNERAALAETVNSIASGKARELDRNSNQIIGEDVIDDFVEFYGGRERRAEKNVGRNSRWANRQARRNSDHHVVNSAISKLGGISDYYDKKAKAAIPTLTRRTAQIEVDGDGKYARGASNDYNKQYIKDVFDYITEARQFNLGDNWGEHMDVLKSWQDRPDYETFIGRLESNELGPAEIDALQRMGLTIKLPEQKQATTHHSDFKGNRDLADRLGIIVTKDKDGNWIITGNENYTKGTWYDDAGLFDGTEFARGGIHNGRIFTREQLKNDDNYPELQNSFDKFIQAGTNANTYDQWWTNILNSSVKFLGNPDMVNPFVTTFNPTDSFSEVWSPFFYNRYGDWLNTRINLSNITNTYQNLDGKQILAYIQTSASDNPSETSARDDLNMFVPQFVVYDPKTNSYQIYDDEAKMISEQNLSPVENRNYIRNGEFRKSDFDIDNKKYAIFKEFIDEHGNTNYILVDHEGKGYIGKKDEDGEWSADGIESRDQWNAVLDMIKKGSQVGTDDIDDLTEYFSTSDINIFNPRSHYYDRKTNRIIPYTPPMRRKNGGKIKPLPKKFQYGGATSKITTHTKTIDPSQVKTDISATHKLDSDAKNFGLTDAEIWQLSGAAIDLAGVALSFIPGAHIASAVTGVGGTAAQLVGDVMKDGFQWGDLGSAGLSLAMDVGTLFGGGAGKVPKVIKAVRAVAPTIMKLFAIHGIVTGAQAIGKAARGEDLTSEDLIDILRGITSTAIGAKIVRNKIGDAQLSKKLEDDVLKTKNASAKAKPTATIDGKKIDVETSQIEGKSKTEVEAYLKEKVKAQLGDKFKEGEHDVDLSKKFGISYDKGEFTGLQWKKIFKGKGFIGRGEKRATFEPDEIDEGSSLFWHYLRPGLRRQNLGYDWGFWSKKGRLGNVSESDYVAAMRRLKDGKYGNHAGGWKIRLRDEALMRQAMLNPKAFGFRFGKGSEYLPGVGWRRTYGRPVHEQNSEPKYVIQNPGSTEPIPTPTVGSSIQNPGSYIPTPTPKVVYPAYITPDVGVRTGKKDLRMYQAQLRHWTPDYGSISPEPLNPAVPQIGHTPVAQIPAKIVDRITWDNESVFKTMPEDAAWWSASDLASWLKSVGITPDKETMESAFDFIGKNRIFKSGGKISKFQDGKKFGSVTGKNVRNSNWNMIGNVAMGLGKAATKLGVGLVQSNRQKNLARENAEIAKSVLATNGPEYYGKFNDFGIKQTYENAATNAESLANNPVSSDPIRNRQFRNAVGSEARQLRAEGNLKQSQAFSEWQNNQDSLRAGYANARTTVENSNRQRAAAADLGLNKELSAGIAQDAGLLSGFVGDVGKVLSIPQASRNQEALIKARNEYEQWQKDLENEYSVWSKETTNAGRTYDDWFTNVKKLDDEKRRRESQLRSLNAAYQVSAIAQNKKGGKVRSANEQIKIDNEKARQKAISQLSKQAFELLKKSLG